MAKTVDLSYHAGDSKPLEIAVLDDDDQPVDISTATEIRWAAAQTAESPTTMIMKTKTGAGISLVAGVGNEHKFQVAMLAGDTSALAPGNYYHEADIVLAGVDETSLTGVYTLKPTILK